MGDQSVKLVLWSPYSYSAGPRKDRTARSNASPSGRHRTDRATTTPSCNSPEIASGEVMRKLALARIGPDLLFATGAVLLLIFVGRAIWLSRARKA